MRYVRTSMNDFSQERIGKLLQDTKMLLRQLPRGAVTAHGHCSHERETAAKGVIRQHPHDRGRALSRSGCSPTGDLHGDPPITRDRDRSPREPASAFPAEPALTSLGHRLPVSTELAATLRIPRVEAQLSSKNAAGRRALGRFGLARPDGPLALTGQRRSRFGRHIAPELDHEIDELERRIEALEARRDVADDSS